MNTEKGAVAQFGPAKGETRSRAEDAAALFFMSALFAWKDEKCRILAEKQAKIR